ncbi:hypothetical protein MMC21_000205 [Puttea exsequens]|nr:hypothetical protein [Puttea exsequens]
MDMQGTPLSSTNKGHTGTKVTSDPNRYENPTTEGAGAVASDSLAADSARSGGKFSDNRDSEPLLQPGSSSTFNTTDTSNATTLEPAPDAAEREAKASYSETADEEKGPGGKKYPEGAGGQPNFPGKHSQQGYVGGPTSAKVETADQSLDGGSGSAGSTEESSGPRGSIERDLGSTGASGSSASEQPGSGSDAKSAPSDKGFTTQGVSDAEAAPGYVGSVVSDPARTGKPHGKNLKEVSDFGESEGNNASFNSDIGGEDDPGRRAENDFQRMTQQSSGSTAPRQGVGESDNSQYDVLDTDQKI